jgi:hypothetical protein
LCSSRRWPPTTGTSLRATRDVVAARTETVEQVRLSLHMTPGRRVRRSTQLMLRGCRWALSSPGWWQACRCSRMERRGATISPL